MKPTKSLLFSSGWKKWITLNILVAAILLPVFTSMAQNTTMRATNYPNAPVKQNSFKGIILVADNMTNWLHKASANPVAFKRANVGASVQPVQNPYIMLCKAKAQPLAKVIKRS